MDASKDFRDAARYSSGTPSTVSIATVPRADDDALTGPVKPDGDHPREAIAPVVGEPGQGGRAEQLLRAGVAKLASQFLRVHSDQVNMKSRMKRVILRR